MIPDFLSVKYKNYSIDFKRNRLFNIFDDFLRKNGDLSFLHSLFKSRKKNNGK